MQTSIQKTSSFCRQTSRGMEVCIRLTPKSAKDSLKGIYVDVEGRSYLKATVTVPPEDGKANKALISLLSRVLKVPKSSIELISGETFRNKIVLINVSDWDDLAQRLDKFA